MTLPLTPVIGNPDLIPGLTSKSVQRLAQQGKSHLVDMWSQGGLPPLAAISTLSDPPLDILSTNQLRHYLQSLYKVHYILHDFTSFKSLCRKGEASMHTLSLLYNYLTVYAGEPIPTFDRHW